MSVRACSQMSLARQQQIDGRSTANLQSIVFNFVVFAHNRVQLVIELGRHGQGQTRVQRDQKRRLEAKLVLVKRVLRHLQAEHAHRRCLRRPRETRVHPLTLTQACTDRTYLKEAL